MNLSHAEVVLSIASETSDLYLEIMERLIKKPIYLCARGETGIPTTDLAGNPLPYPIGHRRGEPPGTSAFSKFATKRDRPITKVDRRTIENVQPNPKQPGSKAYEAYKLYRNGMTVSEFLSLGGSRKDLVWDAKRGFITLDVPEWR